jgi:hypothetical protein
MPSCSVINDPNSDTDREKSLDLERMEPKPCYPFVIADAQQHYEVGKRKLESNEAQLIFYDLYSHLQKAFQTFPTLFNNIICKSVGENLAWQWRNVDTRRLSFQHITEPLKITVTPSYRRLFELEGRDIRLKPYRK